MKIKLLACIAFLSLMSCSGDDSTPVNPDPTPVENKDLKDISYYGIDGDDLIDELRRFENNRLTERYLYDDAGNPYFEDLYAYDNNGRLITRTITTTDDNLSQTIEYDNSGRFDIINEYFPDGTLRTQTIFDYSVENKITETRNQYNSEGMYYTSQKSYDLLPDGRIYKINAGYRVVEVVYEGNNIISSITNYYENGEITSANASNTTYDYVTPVKGEFLKVKSNQFGGNKANHVMYYDGFEKANDKYLIGGSMTTDGVNYTSSVEFEFDADGFPIKATGYVDGEYQNKYVITYQ